MHDDDPRHGTTNGYCNLGCRCAACRAAWAAYCADVKARREPLAADDPRHGRDATYTNHRCRCAACKAAHAVANARRKAARA